MGDIFEAMIGAVYCDSNFDFDITREVLITIINIIIIIMFLVIKIFYNYR